ncbi:hypothetical protein Sango_2792200 [Sesamum angolense]|uniref:Uncharacterized protein n=1 Tax=Sesamum angolense TaxID=2727404 RepID=A0AAE1T8Q4_9LAMI|nr:hypothetical protein Sango_2792200 [Sesamum angolense]
MVFDAVGPSYFASSHEGVLDDGTRSCPMDAGPSSYYYGCGGPYDYDKDARYKPSRGRDPHRKKSPYTVLSPSNPKHLIDVYLELLIEELLQLWHVGVRTYDHATDRAFMMRVALMWTVNDLPTYGMAFGWSTAGVMGCPACMDDTRAFHLQHGRKVSYFECHRQFLPAHHPYRRSKKAFTKNRIENKVARPRLIGDQILDQVANISPAVEMLLSLPDGYGSDHKWTKKNIFWDLPYWSTLLI